MARGVSSAVGEAVGGVEQNIETLERRLLRQMSRLNRRFTLIEPGAAAHSSSALLNLVLDGITASPS